MTNKLSVFFKYILPPFIFILPFQFLLMFLDFNNFLLIKDESKYALYFFIITIIFITFGELKKSYILFCIFLYFYIGRYFILGYVTALMGGV
jgi:hypothetical protein